MNIDEYAAMLPEDKRAGFRAAVERYAAAKARRNRSHQAVNLAKNDMRRAANHLTCAVRDCDPDDGKRIDPLNRLALQAEELSYKMQCASRQDHGERC